MLSLLTRLSLLGLLFAACGKAPEPHEPVWGKQSCESCRMILSEPAYAAQFVDANGRRHFFDDIGCMDAYLTEHGAEKRRAAWVHSGSRWIDAESARYASGAASPMAYGFVAEAGGPLDFASVRRGAAAHRKELSR